MQNKNQNDFNYGMFLLGTFSDISITQGNRTLDEQLKDLNSNFMDEMVWEIKGSSIIPRSIRVAKVTFASLSEPITVNVQKCLIKKTSLNVPDGNQNIVSSNLKKVSKSQLNHCF